MDYGDVLSAGIIACIAKISGQLCIINANDATVKGLGIKMLLIFL